MSYVPITPIERLDGNPGQFPMTRWPEDDTETGMSGVPVIIVAGYAEESGTIDGTDDVFAGFSSEFFHDLATAGTPDPLHYGSVQNQPSAILIPGGAPLSDGLLGIALAKPNIMFQGSLKADQ